jgi:hypothetical protein
MRQPDRRASRFDRRRRPFVERPGSAGRRNATLVPLSMERGVGCTASPVAPIPTPLSQASVAFLAIRNGLLHTGRSTNGLRRGWTAWAHGCSRVSTRTTRYPVCGQPVERAVPIAGETWRRLPGTAWGWGSPRARRERQRPEPRFSGLRNRLAAGQVSRRDLDSRERLHCGPISKKPRRETPQSRSRAIVRSHHSRGRPAVGADETEWITLCEF